MRDPRAVRAWQSAILVAVRTRALVTRFPRRGYAKLREQMISAAESISHNIAEGCGASSATDYCRFLDQATRSASELSSQIDLALAYNIAPKKEAFALNGTVIVTRRMIRSLQEVIRADEAQKPPMRTAVKPRSRKR
jgi:four helix bundle protein